MTDQWTDPRPPGDPDTPPDPEPETAGADTSADPNVPCIIPGVPFFALDNPFGGQGIGVLVGFDPEGLHEKGQPANHPGTDTTPERPRAISGGAAYYMDFTTGKGWSVALNPGGEA